MPVMTFHLMESELKAINDFEDQQNKLAIEKQKEEFLNPTGTIKTFWDSGLPYTGAVSCSIEYRFTPTSLGTVIKVKHPVTEEELDVTDYTSW